MDPRLTEGDLEYFFEQVGDVEKVIIRSGAESRQAIVTFKKADDAKKAVEQCNGFKLLANILKVENHTVDYRSNNSGGVGELDGGDGQSIRLDSRSRLAIMNRLNQRAGISMIQVSM
jgi:RNA recognition motif-containing protein